MTERRKGIGPLLERIRIGLRGIWLPRLRKPPVETSRRDIRGFVGAGAATLAVIAALRLFFPTVLPANVLVFGSIIGALNALPAIGIVLVFRANRIINFAQGELGAFAASLSFLLIATLHWKWIAAVPLSLLAATVVGALVEFGIIRRFFQSPRLILTVATLGLAQFLGGLRLGLPEFFPELPGLSGTFPSPFHHLAFSLGSSAFTYDDVLILVAAPAALLVVALFLRWTWGGLGTRAAAQNIDRSRLMGIRVRRLSTLVWAFAALLSAVTSILRAPVVGFSLLASSGSGGMVRALVPAAIGGFVNLPLTFAAAVVMGVVEQAFFWNFTRGGPIVAILLVVLLIALLVRGATWSRLEASEAGLSWANVQNVRRIPRAILNLREVKVARWVAGATLGILLVIAPKLLSPGQLSLAGLMSVHLIVGLSLILLTGWIGQVSLGQWAIAGLAAFLTGHAATRWGLDFFVVLMLGALAGGLVSLLLGIPGQRMPGILFGATTLAFAVAASNWLFQLPAFTYDEEVQRPILFGRISLESTNSFYYFMVIVSVIAVAVTYNIKKYRSAARYLAVRDNPRAAESFGISVGRTRRSAFFISGCFAGVAGVLYAFHQGFIEATRFPAEFGISALAMVVIGGLGSISGVIVGAIFVRGTQYLLPAWLHFFVTGFGLLIVLLVFPGGIGDVLFRIRYRFVNWIARRRGIILTPGAGVAPPQPVPQGKAAT